MIIMPLFLPLLSVDAVIVAVALAWVWYVYSTYSGILHAGRVRRIMYMNDRVRHDNTRYTLNLPLLLLCVFL